jgi:peptidyl-prolyl cis-trans isomerase SurA
MALCGVLFVLLLATPLAAQDPKQQPTPPPAPTLEQPKMAPETEQPAKEKEAKPRPATPAVKPNPSSGAVVEEIIARVNNEIITRTEYEKSMAQTEEETRQDCQGKCTPEQLQNELEARKKNALRDLIDQSLLAQRGKDLGISVETDVIKQLDQVRIQNKLKDMD